MEWQTNHAHKEHSDLGMRCSPGPKVMNLFSCSTSNENPVLKARCTQLRRAINNVRCEGRNVMN